MGEHRTPRWPVGLLYHGIPAQDEEFVDSSALERQIVFLKKHFNTVRLPDSVVEAVQRGKPRVVVTFDDGYRNNAEVAAPVLRRYGVPATFFVCNRHTQPGKYLWFSYLRALENHFRGNGFDYNGEFIDMSGARRQESVKRLRGYLLSLRPHPAAMYLEIDNQLPNIEDFVEKSVIEMRYAGMTEEQIHELSNNDLFSVQAHTADHPLLTMCTHKDALAQISESKTWLEKLTGKECSDLAYPGGDYDADIIRLCQSAGFQRGHAVIPKRLNIRSYEIPRVGVFSKSLAVFGIKARFGRAIRNLGIPVG